MYCPPKRVDLEESADSMLGTLDGGFASVPVTGEALKTAMI